MLNLQRWFYEGMYRFSRPRWDTGITPPEVVTLVESSDSRGRALDLGCGTGTNSIYLARHGFDVVGVDFSPKAIEMAREKARQAGAAVDFHLGDVTNVDFLRAPFELVLDVGCFHSLDAARRVRYAENLARLTHPGSVFMMHGFSRGGLLRNLGVTSEEVQRQFAPHFVVSRVEHGACSNGRTSAWFWLNRQ
jgi:SAM-dependent methyltransferase